MIYDSIGNVKNYTSLGPDFREAFDFILGNRFEKKPGRYALKGKMYYMVQEYETKPESEGFFEAHRKFIDLQYVVKGRELHKVANVSMLKLRTAYDDEKDVLFLDGSGSGFIMETGYFTVYFPEDAHIPNLRFAQDPEKVLKVVVKIPSA